MTGYERARFVGRAEALRFAEDRLHQAAAGHGKMLLLAGEPGIGKSRFAHELGVRAPARGWTTVTGRCYEFEATQPYGPVIEAIRQLVKRIDTSRLAAIAGRVGPEIGMIVPELRPLVGSALPNAADVDRFRLFESVIGLMLALAQDCTAGLLVVLGDLHWADEATVRLVAQFARRLEDEHILLAASYRTTEIARGTPLAAALAELHRERLAETIQFGPLDEAETGRLVSALAGDLADR